MIQLTASSFISVSCPEWFNIKSRATGQFSGTATISLVGASSDLIVDLKMWDEGDRLFVSELLPGAHFPAVCPERHINSNASFCLAYEADRMVVDKNSAAVWWGLLYEFLKNQRTAERTHSWPVRKAVSHGQAGKYHLEALEAARILGIEEDYYKMLEGESFWLNSRWLKLDPTGTRLLNGRMPCPVGCTGRRGRVRQRRKCCRKEAVIRLVRAEHARRKAEEVFWQEIRKDVATCCGRMNHCPLALGKN